MKCRMMIDVLCVANMFRREDKFVNAVRNRNQTFENNSIIDVIAPVESRRGIRYNDILCGTPFESSVLNIIRSWEFDYRSGRSVNDDWRKEYHSCEWKQPEADPMDVITDTTELDNFLNGFTVIS